MDRISKLAVCIVAVCLGAPLCAQADIYRYVDENGTVHFSNIPNDARFRLYMTTNKEPDAVSNTVTSRIVHSYPKAARSRYHAHIVAAARTYQLEPALLHAVISAESGYNPLARSSKGARGLMQLMPATAALLHVEDPFDPEQNVQAGAAFLKQLLGRYKGDLRLALVAYNAGTLRADQPADVPYPLETQGYLASIFAQLGMSQPQMLPDIFETLPTAPAPTVEMVPEPAETPAPEPEKKLEQGDSPPTEKSSRPAAVPPAA